MLSHSIEQQKGVGMIEVLVALILLSIAVLGFAALQIRAVEATHEALNRVQAMNIARDLAERIRINPYSLTVLTSSGAAMSSSNSESAYLTAVESNKASILKYAWEKCFKTDLCSSANLAVEDVKQVVYKAQLQGMKINLLNCQALTTTGTEESAVVTTSSLANSRKCIYVAWDKTTATDGANAIDCTQYGVYKDGAQCVILEAY